MKSEPRENQDWERLRKMREKIEEIDGLVLELKVLGKGVPMMEKNVHTILSLSYIIKSGRSNRAVIMDQKTR